MLVKGLSGPRYDVAPLPDLPELESARMHGPAPEHRAYVPTRARGSTPGAVRRSRPADVRPPAYPHVMAFKTRSGRTVALGTGTVATAQALTVLSILISLVPVIVSAMLVAWFVNLDARTAIEEALPSAYAVAITFLGVVLMLQIFAGVTLLTGFIGPRNRLRDQVLAVLESRTGRIALLGFAIGIALVIAFRFPLGAGRNYFIIGLPVALTAVYVFLFIRLLRIALSNKRTAYFEGMTPLEKRIAGRTWSPTRHPDFPDLVRIEDAEDARRYARRAHDAAELHTWLGAGIIVIFSAFVGTSISWSWEDPEASSPVPMLLVLGFLALGFWIQRRAGSFRDMERALQARASELEQRLMRQSTKKRSPWLSRVFRTLFARERAPQAERRG